MIVKGIYCGRCGDKVFSRARHDFRMCSCKSIFVDGGFDYFRVGGNTGLPIDISVDATKQELFDDWNRKEDKYGKTNDLDK